MVVKVDTPDRRQLAKLAGDDPEVMRFLESLFDQAGTRTPTDIENIDADLSQLREDIDTNSADITFNEAGIANNVIDIGLNAAGIAANAALIAAITGTQGISQSDSPFAPVGSGTLLCDATDGEIVIALAPSTTNAIINVKKIDTSENAVTLTPTTGTIDGSISAPITTPFLTLTAISNGTDWFII